MRNNNLHMVHKQQSYKWGFLLSVQIIEQNHTFISIFPTVIYSSTFIQNKAQSTLGVSANSAVHGMNVLLGISCWMFVQMLECSTVNLCSQVMYFYITNTYTCKVASWQRMECSDATDVESSLECLKSNVRVAKACQTSAQKDTLVPRLRWISSWSKQIRLVL